MGQLVGPFGGITAAVMLRAIETQPDRIGEPLALTVNFTAPIADGDFDISTSAARTNRTINTGSPNSLQDGAVTTTATAVFGIRRDTWASTEAHPPTAPRQNSSSPVVRATSSSGDRLLRTLAPDITTVPWKASNPAKSSWRPNGGSRATLWMRFANTPQHT